MKGVVDSPSSLLNIMIPQYQQLLPLETSLSGSWLNTTYSSESNKLPSPPVSVTPSSICTDLSESEYRPIDLSSSRKYSISSPPLSNTKCESIDLMDCISIYSKENSAMISPNSDQNLLEKSKLSFKKSKLYSNFTIEHLLSASQPPTFHLLSLPHKQMNSIFTKKKMIHFSDQYLHRIIHHTKPSKQHHKSSSLSQYSIPPRGVFIRYIFDLFNDLIKQQTPDKFFPIDPLEQLAEIACKLDTRHRKSLLSNENNLISKTNELLLKECYLLIQRIYRKYLHKKLPKRLDCNSKLNSKNRSFHFLLSILNRLQMKKNILVNHFDYHILLSDIQKNPIEKIKTNKKIKSICLYLKPEQIVSNMEILLPHNGLLYEGVIQPVEHYNDLLLVRLHHERQTYLIPIHDLCRLACPKMIPEDCDAMSKGLRVCAYWSTSLRGLHPAIIKRIPSNVEELCMVNLLFDDGDTGFIKLDEIRLLPDDYDAKGINLEEWRVSSFQLPSSLRSTRRVSSITTASPVKRIKKEKTSSSPSIVAPQWTFNNRNSTICHSDTKEVLHAGDCIVLRGADESLSYNGKVLKFYRNRSTQQDLVKLKWYYSPAETPTGLHDNDLPGALYESTHTDENPIATIRSKGTIYNSYDEYIKQTDHGNKRKETDFYLVGHYNPTSGKLQRYNDK